MSHLLPYFVDSEPAATKVYRFDKVLLNWTVIGDMMLPRGSHAVTTVKMNQIINYCNNTL